MFGSRPLAHIDTGFGEDRLHGNSVQPVDLCEVGRAAYLSAGSDLLLKAEPQSVSQRHGSCHNYNFTLNQMNPIQAIRFIKKHGIILESAHGSVPNLAETVTGERIRGSWWAHPKGQDIFRLTRAVRDSDDILVCRLVHGKITYVHRRLWPALVRLAKQFEHEHLGRIREVHTSRGKHVLHIVSYPRWVPADVKLLAGKMSETEAVFQLGEWCLQGRNRLSRGAA